METEIKTVSELHVQCMFQVKNFGVQGFAASDCCLMPATAAVVYPSGLKMFRCEEHKSLIDANTSAEFVRTIKRRVK